MEYRVELLNDFNVVGMECDSKNDNAEITKVWEVFNERESIHRLTKLHMA